MSRRPVVITSVVVAVVVLAVVVVALLDDAFDPDPHAGRMPVGLILARAAPAVAPFEGLSEVHASIGYERCLRLVVADSEAERVAGLRDHAADLGPYDGMLFEFPAPSSAAFTMSGVTDPLDIAFFDQDGARNSTHAMKPCPAKAENQCPVYRADGQYAYAVETKPGQLPSGPITACAPS
jgi:uncharacterized membrane protein (UPF0127 family)